MPSFDINSNFSKKAGFTSVKFGSDAPVLECELNEMQQIQDEARADIIRDTIPSGFVKLGELDFDYSANNPNTIRLKSESVAYVNGYRILIPKGTTFDLGAPPEDKPREDLVFLEVWKEEVTCDDTLHVQGGENLGTTPNLIKDPRYSIETSRRIALKWRIRIGEVDFNAFPQGLNEPSSGQSTLAFVMPQGALEEPLAKEVDWSKNFVSYAKRDNNSALNFNSGDAGIFTAGHKDVNYFNTLDKCVYGVPMFRILRRPSCGKSKPLEYQKLHPNSYALSQPLSNKMERVLEANVKGQTIFNLYDTSKDTIDYSSVLVGSIPKNFTVHPDETIQIADNTSGFNVKLGTKKGKMIKPSTKYSFITYVSEYTCTKDTDFLHLYYGDACFNGAFEGNTQEIKKAGVYLDVLTSRAELDPASDDIPMLNVVYQLTTGGVKFKVMIVEGDLTGKPLPNFCSYGDFISVGSGNNSVVLKATGSNLLNHKAFSPMVNGGDSYLIPDGIKVKGTSNSNYKYVYVRISLGRLKPRTKYVLGFKRKVKEGVSTVVLRRDGLFLMQSLDDSALSFTTDEKSYAVYTVDLFSVNGTVNYGEVDYTEIFLREVPTGVDASDLTYVPYKDYKKTYQLDAPLRGMKNVYDEITYKNNMPVLIRRMGEVTLNGSDDEDWALDIGAETTTTLRFYMTNKYNIRNNSRGGFLTCNRFRSRVGNHGAYEYILIHYTEQSGTYEPKNRIFINIDIDKLETQDLAGFKKWLKANPVILLYNNTIEQVIPLVEAREDTINFTLDRQFQNTNRMRELKDGTKDYIKGGKVHRKVGVLRLNGSEVMDIANEQNSDTNPTICFRIPVTSIPRNAVSLSTIVPFYSQGVWNGQDFITKEGIATDEINLFVRVLKSRLVNGEGITGFKNMLTNTPITILYPLKAEVVEDIFEGVNDRPHPYHTINSSVGELYLEDGMNYVSAISSPVIPVIDKVRTPFRQFTSTLPSCELEDCHYRKHPQGLPTCVVGGGKNLIDFRNITPVPNNSELELRDNGFVVCNLTGTAISYSRAIIYDVILKPNTTYTLSYENSVGEGEALVSIRRQIDDVVVLDSSSKSITFTTPSIQTKYKFQFYCTGASAFNGGRVAYTNIQLEEGKSSTTYEEFIPKEEAYEFLQARDVKDLRHIVSLSGFDYETLLNKSLDKLLRGDIDQ